MAEEIKPKYFKAGANIATGQLVAILGKVSRSSTNTAYATGADIVDTATTYTAYPDNALLFPNTIPTAALSSGLSRTGGGVEAEFDKVSSNMATIKVILNEMLNLDPEHNSASDFTQLTLAAANASYTFQEPTFPAADLSTDIINGSQINLYLRDMRANMMKLAYVANLLLPTASDISLGGVPKSISSRQLFISSSFGNFGIFGSQWSTDASQAITTAAFTIEMDKIVRTQLTLFTALKAVRNSSRTPSLAVKD